MANNQRQSVGNQVILICGLICTMLVAIGVFLFFSLRSIDHKNKILEGQILNELTLNNDIAGNVRLEQNEISQYLRERDGAEWKRHEQIISHLEKTNAGKWNDYGKFVDNETETKFYATALEDRKKYLEATDTLLALSRTNKQMEARNFALSTQSPAYEEYQRAIDEIVNWTAKESGQMATGATALIDRTKRIGDALVGIAMLVSIGAGFALGRITRRLKEDNIVLQTEVAERKRAEKTLRESEEKFRQLAGNITDVFWVTSADLQQIHYINPAYELIWGRSVESLYAHPHQWVETILPEERERVFGVFAALMENQSMVSVEYQIARLDGTIRWIHDRRFQVRDAAGKLIRLTGIATDITERKLIESRMFQSQKMETVGKLAGGVAHEFNSLLTAIIGQSELLLEDLPPEGTLGDSAREIRDTAERAATLTRQLLAYGRKQILQPAILDLNVVLADMISTLQHLMGREVDVRLVPAMGLKAVKIDPGQMEQVIVNIAMNAAEAMPNGGKFTLETSNVSLDEDFVRPYQGLKAGDYVALSMTDTGTGMSDEVKVRAFEPFFSTKGAGQGTGLGLATCYGILKQSEGHINLYSEVARGSTFKIYLPQVEPQVKTDAPRLKATHLPRGTETILLAEDDASLLKMASTLLRRLGYTVLTAANGLEAMNLGNQRDIGHIDLLLTDVVMPHMSGKELSDRIHAIYPHTKILFTSAYTENAIVHQGILNQGVRLLQKPFTPSGLANKVRETLDQPLSSG
jgi:two-component system, cell cycle sensor histidine kinase and response regulator CckA